MRSDDLDADDVLQGAALGGGELAVDDHRVGAARATTSGRAPRALPEPEVGGGVGVVAPLDEAVQDLGAGGLGQGGQLAQGGFGVLDRVPPTPRTRPGRGRSTSDDLLQADLAVLDLGDVLQLGGKVSYSAQGAALGEVFLISIELGVLTLNIGNFTRAGVEHAAATARRRALVMRGARGIVGGQ